MKALLSTPAPPPARRILPSTTERLLIASAVHAAVCRVTESDGFGHCAVYAAVAARVMSRLTGRRYVVQSGLLSIRLSRAFRDEWPEGITHFQIDGRAPRPGAAPRAASDMPEVHVWCGADHTDPGELARFGGDAVLLAELHASRSECIDLSARHWARFVNALDPRWPGEGDFQGKHFWTTGDQFPEGVALVPDFATTMVVEAKLRGEPLRSMVERAAVIALARVGPRHLPVAGGGGKKKRRRR